MNVQREERPTQKFTALKDKKPKKLEAILGVIQKKGRLWHLVKWKESACCELVDSGIINRQFPAQVIEYYQTNLKFTPNPKKWTHSASDYCCLRF